METKAQTSHTATAGVGVRRLVLWVCLGIALVAVPPLLPSYYLHLLILSIVYGFLAAGLNLLMGEAGLTSFGHGAVFGIAAYTVGVLTTRFDASFFVAASLGLLAALLAVGLFGLLVSHLRGDQFLLATLALGMVVWGVAYRWVSVTGGDNGLPGIRRPEILGVSFRSQEAMYFLCLAFFVLVLWLISIIRRSGYGYSLRGIRENHIRVRALGYNVWLHKYIGMLISGLIAGLGGVLYAYYNGFVSPVDVHITTSVQGVLMVIVGGTGTLLGPALGSAIVVVIREFLSAYTERWNLILGALYVVIMLYAPGGLVGLLGRRNAKGG